MSMPDMESETVMKVEAVEVWRHRATGARVVIAGLEVGCRARATAGGRLVAATLGSDDAAEVLRLMLAATRFAPQEGAL